MSKRNIPETKFDFHFYCYTDDHQWGYMMISMLLTFLIFLISILSIGLVLKTLSMVWPDVGTSQNFVFNFTHNFGHDNATGRFVFFDLDVIIQRDLTPIITHNLEQPTKMRSWWQDPRPMLSRRFKLSHGAYTNGSCQVWSDDQCEPIWEDVLKNQEKIWYTFTDGTDNYHSWRWGIWVKTMGLLSLLDGVLLQSRQIMG